MENKDIVALLKRRRWKNNPEFYRVKQREYRERLKEYLPHCNECEQCILVKNDKGTGTRRLCIDEMRLIERKVSNSPLWCSRRKK